MFDGADIRDCYVALGQLIARTSDIGFGDAAAVFLATTSGASRVQYWELSAGSEAFVLLGDAQQGDSLNKSASRQLPLRRDGRSLCPFDLVALSGDLVTASARSGFDLSRLATVFGDLGAEPVALVPLKTSEGSLFGCAVFGGVAYPPTLTSTVFRIAAQAVVRLGERDRNRKRLQRNNVELSAALRRFDQEKQQQRESVDRKLTQALPGRSRAMQVLRTRLQKLARGDGPVLISTPGGDGAEPFLRELHRLGKHGNEPCLVVHAATLSGDKLAIDLFGHKRGIVPGVSGARRGTLREAGRGTVLLDRIEDLDLAGQEQVLRLLQARVFRPFGSSRDMPLQARIAISVRHESLLDKTEASVLPALYYELKSSELVVPSLSSTVEDAKDLLLAELERAGFDDEERAHCLSDNDLNRLLLQRAPAHSRASLSALIRSALEIATSKGDPLGAVHLKEAEQTPSAPVRPAMAVTLPERMAEYEAELIADALDRFDGRRADAARWLSIPKRTLADKCQRYGL